MTGTSTRSASFTIIHARELSSRVAADMHLCARYYGNPSETWIRAYAEELAQAINAGYVDAYEFGYEKNGVRIVTWRYTVDVNGNLTVNDRPGNVAAYVDISGAKFFNFMSWNDAFFALSSDARTRFKADLPVQRTDGQPPSDGTGYWTSDRNYYSGGCGLGRQTFQPRV